MLEIKVFEFGSFGTNTYVVSDCKGNVLLVDPACSNGYERQVLHRYIDSLRGPEGRQTVVIAATHGHLDHLWGARWACEQWGGAVLLHRKDHPLAEAMQRQYELFGIPMQAQPFPLADLQQAVLPEGEVYRFEVIETPGHTPGGVCLYWKDEQVLLSGDTLFRMGYGRTDLPGGNTGQLIESLERLFLLPPETRVYPGHGERTTIGEERR
jgi:glyoxylase-like metal-dependent hydrolase (beta-lactamase superfamily II)